jgi:competence protein ComEA
VFDGPAADATSAAAPAVANPTARPVDLVERIRALPMATIAGALVGLAGLAIAVILAVGGVDGGISVDGATAVGSPAADRSIGPSSEIVVDVAGAVLRPGVYHLPAGARIGDAIAAAGGYSTRVAADLASRQLNLAALVHDGDQVIVPSRDDAASSSSVGSGGGAGGAGSGGGTGGGLVDLNHASADELDALPGIGPVTAAKIIAARQAQPFASVDDLLERKLVSQRTFDEIKALVRV